MHVIITSAVLASSVFMSGHDLILINTCVFFVIFLNSNITVRLQLAPERGFLPVASEKHELWGGALTNHPKEWMKRK